MAVVTYFFGGWVNATFPFSALCQGRKSIDCSVFLGATSQRMQKVRARTWLRAIFADDKLTLGNNRVGRILRKCTFWNYRYVPYSSLGFYVGDVVVGCFPLDKGPPSIPPPPSPAVVRGDNEEACPALCGQDTVDLPSLPPLYYGWLIYLPPFPLYAHKLSFFFLFVRRREDVNATCSSCGEFPRARFPFFWGGQKSEAMKKNRNVS